MRVAIFKNMFDFNSKYPLPHYKSPLIKLLISEKQIRNKIQALAHELTKKFQSKNLKKEREVVAVCVLNGALFLFC